MPRNTLVAAVALAVATITSGCVPAPAPWSGSPSPFGALDTATINADGSATIVGWADESDADGPVNVVAFTSGKIVGSSTANQPRPDVNRTYPLSIDTGFSITTSNQAIQAGDAVCVSALNRNRGSHAVLGCTIVVAGSTAPITQPSTPPTSTPPTSTPPTSAPLPEPADPRITSIASGFDHVVALLEDGTVRAWGSQTFGQLGNGVVDADNDSPTAVAVAGLSGVVDIAASEYHSFAVLEDGSVWAWGRNALNQLGPEATTTIVPTPVQVTGITSAIKVETQSYHAVALLEDGSVVRWGSGVTGNYKAGAFADAITPEPVAGIAGAVDIALGHRFALALLEDGTVKSWGRGESGELGNGSNAHSDVPVDVDGINSATAISADHFTAYAVLEDSTVLGWGSDANGYLGSRSNGNALTPLVVDGLHDVTAVFPNGGSQFARLRDGSALSWGANVPTNRLMNGTSGSSTPTPAAVTGLTGVQEVIGSLAFFALLADGTVWGWGEGDHGLFGPNNPPWLDERPMRITGLFTD